MAAPWWTREDRGPTSAELRAHVLAQLPPEGAVSCSRCGITWELAAAPPPVCSNCGRAWDGRE